MSYPPIPTPLDHLGSRPFSFYPPILNIDHNEWLFRKATWSEILVVNCKSAEEIWIPRRFVGEVSQIDDPVIIVGLTKDLEYKAGSVWPYQRRVIEMPIAVGGSPRHPVAERAGPAPVVNISLSPATDTRMIRMVGGTLAVVILLYVGGLTLIRVGALRQRAAFTARDQSYLDLTGRDDYMRVVGKLGAPASERWLTRSGDNQYRALGYPLRKYTVILMGSDRESATYIGTMDDNWRPVHSVELPTGATTSSLLRGLHRF